MTEPMEKFTEFLLAQEAEHPALKRPLDAESFRKNTFTLAEEPITEHLRLRQRLAYERAAWPGRRPRDFRLTVEPPPTRLLTPLQYTEHRSRFEADWHNH